MFKMLLVCWSLIVVSLSTINIFIIVVIVYIDLFVTVANKNIKYYTRQNIILSK